MPLASPLIAFIVGLVALVIAYVVPNLPPPVRVLLQVFGYSLAIVGGVLLVLILLGWTFIIGPPLIALVLGIVLLVVVYAVPGLPQPARTLLMISGYILAIIGGILLVLLLLGVPLPALR